MLKAPRMNTLHDPSLHDPSAPATAAEKLLAIISDLPGTEAQDFSMDYLSEQSGLSATWLSRFLASELFPSRLAAYRASHGRSN